MQFNWRTGGENFHRPRARDFFMPRRGLRTSGRFSHILVPADADLPDPEPVRFAANLAADHAATLTVLHVLPDTSRSTAPLSLDAVSLLHEAARSFRGKRPALSAVEMERRAREQLRRLVDKCLDPERTPADLRLELRRGCPTEQVLRFVESDRVDLLILSTGPQRPWLPVLPGRIRRLVRRASAATVLFPLGRRSDQRSPALPIHL